MLLPDDKPENRGMANPQNTQQIAAHALGAMIRTIEHDPDYVDSKIHSKILADLSPSEAFVDLLRDTLEHLIDTAPVEVERVNNEDGS
jgi:hypothetical protein